jgi:hypothetical protein
MKTTLIMFVNKAEKTLNCFVQSFLHRFHWEIFNEKPVFRNLFPPFTSTYKNLNQQAGAY